MKGKELDRLVLEENQVVFINAVGKRVDMPNLSQLTKWYKEQEDAEIKERIKGILEREIGDLLIAEVMIDMTNEKTLERLRTGEISKTLGHVQTYNIILDSHIEEARAEFEEKLAKGETSGQFEDCFFAQFPYGMVIMRDMFKGFRNTNYDKSDLEQLIQ